MKYFFLIILVVLVRFPSFSQGTITSLNCSSSIPIGTITKGVAISGASTLITYSGGNGGSYPGKSIASTGVTGLTATLAPGNFANGSGTLTFIISGTASIVGTANFALSIGGRSCVFTRTVVPVGAIATLNCSSATHNGTLVAGVAAASVNSVVPYTGGNGGSFNGRIFSSTGVTGLTASILGGTFSNGSGNLTFNISGTPNAIGAANFSVTLGGKTCSFSRIVNQGSISSLNCSASNNFGTLVKGQPASSETKSVVYYDGGNGGLYNGQTVSSIGVLGLTATLLPGKFAIGGQQLTYTISGTPTTSGIASFALNIGGRSCILNRTVYPSGTISTLSCNSPTHSGTLISGKLTSGGVSSSISYSGGNGGFYNGQTVTSSGVTGLTAVLLSGILANGSGNLIYYISGTPASSGAANFTISVGGKSCVFSRTVVPGSITGLSCTSATQSGNLVKNVAAIGVSTSVPYTGGNGGSYPSVSVPSIGVTGLTANLAAGNFLSGNGSLNFTISGTPTASGIANFSISIGGRSCTFYRSVANDGTGSPATCGATNVHNSSKTYGTVTDFDGNVYKTVTIGSNIWMAENLKVSHYRNGDPIPNLVSDADWGATAELPYGSARGTGAWCHMNNNPANECPYGKLYNFFAVRDPRGLCPAGWVVPAGGDPIPFVDNMLTSLGGTTVAGGKLKSAGNFYWASPNTGATNSSGFSGLPGGIRISCCGDTRKFWGFNQYGAWWTSSLHDSGTEAYALTLSSSNSSASVENSHWTRMGLAVRCVKSTTPARLGTDPFVPSSSVFPNPTSGKFSMQFDATSDYQAAIQISDLNGRVLQEEKREIVSGLNTLSIEVSTLPPGLYLVFVNSPQNQQVFKIVKQ
jgi:uncharacterized protein (TIGR02145 family)